MSDFFGEYSKRASEFKATDRQLAFQEKIVRALLGHFNLAANLGQLKKEVQESHDYKALNLQWFQDNYPGFPARLGARKLEFMHKVTLGHLFGKQLFKNPFFRACQDWLAAEDLDPADSRFLFVFNCPEASTASLMALHNAPVESTTFADPNLRTERGTRIIRPYGNPLVYYVIESLADYLDNIGSDWVPTE